MSAAPAVNPLYLRCPACGAQPGDPCVTKAGYATTFHRARRGRKPEPRSGEGRQP